MTLEISVSILTKNSERYLRRCLEALKYFEEVVILDNGSEDKTTVIASSFPNTKLVKSEFIGFGPLKNYAANLAKYDWILSVDSDEILTQELVEEISNLTLDKNTIYSIKRENHYDNKLVKGCGWYPDRVLRLYNKKTASYKDALVHESLVITDKIRVVQLDYPIKHYAFNNASDLIEKMQLYSTLFAKENKGKIKSSIFKALLRSILTFVQSYFLKRGFLSGYEGLLISISNANGVFYKYIKLYEENKR
jgi:glycosyltransferase involved in cell wall biosynthesis